MAGEGEQRAAEGEQGGRREATNAKHAHTLSIVLALVAGDDDTLWFLEGLRRLLSRFDALSPYFISDNLVDYLFEPE